MTHVSVILTVCMLAGMVRGQEEVHNRAYAFAERAPTSVVERTIAARLPSLVKIHGASGFSTIVPYATGIIVSERGHVLTLDLVMLQVDQTRVVLHDGSVYPAKLLPADRRLGVRMLQIDPGDKVLTPVVPTSRRDWRHGTFVVSIGNCFRLAEFSEKMSATFGVLVARTRTGLRYRMSEVDHDGELLITDAPNNPGHQGGGLFSLRGEWLGINTRVVESVETNTQISAAIPSWDLVRYIERFTKKRVLEVEQEPVATPTGAVYHGITLFESGLRRSPPAYVERVASGSPARTIGLRPDDLIVRIDEYPVRSCAEFHRVMQKMSPGHTVELTFKRGAHVLRRSLTLEQKK